MDLYVICSVCVSWRIVSLLPASPTGCGGGTEGWVRVHQVCSEGHEDVLPFQRGHWSGKVLMTGFTVYIGVLRACSSFCSLLDGEVNKIKYGSNWRNKERNKDSNSSCIFSCGPETKNKIMKSLRRRLEYCTFNAIFTTCVCTWIEYVTVHQNNVHVCIN